MEIKPSSTQVFWPTVVSAVKTLIEHCREDPSREGLRDTPDRVAKALLELTIGYTHNPREILSTTFEESSDQLIILRDIPFTSLCEHHMLPFYGVATVGYLPGKRVVGLSKLARLVECYSRRLQIQERLTDQIATALMEHLAPQGAGCVIQAHHSCMSIRGVKSQGTMVTSSLQGAMRDECKSEFLSLVQWKDVGVR